MIRKLGYAFLILVAAAHAQTLTFPALSTNNTFTGTNTFTNTTNLSGTALFNSTSTFTGNTLFTGNNIFSVPGVFTNVSHNVTLQSLVGGVPSDLWHTGGVGYGETGYLTSGMQGAVQIPSGSTQQQADGGEFWAVTYANSSGRTANNAVGMFSGGVAVASGSAAWGANITTGDLPTSFGGSPNTNVIGIETDVGVGNAPSFVQGNAITLSANRGIIGTMPNIAVACPTFLTCGAGLVVGSNNPGFLAWQKGVVLQDTCCSASLPWLEIGAISQAASSTSGSLGFARFDSSGIRHNSENISADSTGNIIIKAAGAVQLPAVRIFSSIGTCNSGVEGMITPVSDSTTNTWGATITGSGSNHVLAYCDGSNWTVAAK